LHGSRSTLYQGENGSVPKSLVLLTFQIEVKHAQPKGRERDQNINPRGGGNYVNAGNSSQNEFNPQPGMVNQMYGGMSPALMAQWYQRMQAYYMAMGRGMMPAMQMSGGPMMGMPNMAMQGMPMTGGMPPMGQQMMGGMGQQPAMGGYGGGMPMQQGGYGSPPPQPQYQPEPPSHEGEYVYDNISDQGPGQQHSPPPVVLGEVPAGPKEGPPPNAPTGPSSGGGKPYGGGAGRGRAMVRGVGRGYSGGGGYQGGMARGGGVRYNPYGR
jgi:RNA-binding protein Musashi